MKTKALIPENPLLVLPSLAVKIGLKEAIILQQIHYWILKSKHLYDGRYWIYNTYLDWQKQFPFWGESTIKKTILKMEKDGLLISGNFNKLKQDRTKWYSIDYEKIPEILLPTQEIRDNQLGNNLHSTKGDGLPLQGMSCTHSNHRISSETTNNNTSSFSFINKRKKKYSLSPFETVVDDKNIEEKNIQNVYKLLYIWNSLPNTTKHIKENKTYQKCLSILKKYIQTYSFELIKDIFIKFGEIEINKKIALPDFFEPYNKKEKESYFYLMINLDNCSITKEMKILIDIFTKVILGGKTTKFNFKQIQQFKVASNRLKKDFKEELEYLSFEKLCYLFVNSLKESFIENVSAGNLASNSNYNNIFLPFMAKRKERLPKIIRYNQQGDPVFDECKALNDADKRKYYSILRGDDIVCL